MKKKKINSSAMAKISKREFFKEALKRYPEERGWIVLKTGKGFPDVVCYNKKTKQAEFIELKSCLKHNKNLHHFHMHQKQMLYILIKSKKRSARVIGYKINSSNKNAIKCVDKNAMEYKAKDWEGVKDKNLICAECSKPEPGNKHVIKNKTDEHHFCSVNCLNEWRKRNS